MKEVFMPSMDDLYKMQDMGADIRLYLYAKAIETLCIEYNNFPKKGSVLKNEFAYIRENEILSHAICMMYPKEIEYSGVAKYDMQLADALITKMEDRSIYRLDNLSGFSDMVAGSDTIIKKTISILSEELKNNPKYRFEYKNSKTLEDIFMGRIKLEELYPGVYSGNIKSLASIEPYYALECPDEYWYGKQGMLEMAVIDYINRYGFDFRYTYNKNNDKKKDILTNQDTEVKRLFRCIKRK